MTQRSVYLYRRTFCSQAYQIKILISIEIHLSNNTELFLKFEWLHSCSERSPYNVQKKLIAYCHQFLWCLLGPSFGIVECSMVEIPGKGSRSNQHENHLLKILFQPPYYNENKLLFYNFYGVIDRKIIEIVLNNSEAAMTNIFFMNEGKYPSQIEICSDKKLSMTLNRQILDN